jgi:hypothetical protein
MNAIDVNQNSGLLLLVTFALAVQQQLSYRTYQ